MSDKLINKYKRLFNKLNKVEEDIEVAHIVQDEIYRKFIKDIANNKIKDLKIIMILANDINKNVVAKDKDRWYA